MTVFHHLEHVFFALSFGTFVCAIFIGLERSEGEPCVLTSIFVADYFTVL